MCVELVCLQAHEKSGNMLVPCINSYTVTGVRAINRVLLR